MCPCCSECSKTKESSTCFANTLLKLTLQDPTCSFVYTKTQVTCHGRKNSNVSNLMNAVYQWYPNTRVQWKPISRLPLLGRDNYLSTCFASQIHEPLLEATTPFFPNFLITLNRRDWNDCAIWLWHMPPGSLHSNFVDRVYFVVMIDFKWGWGYYTSISMETRRSLKSQGRILPITHEISGDADIYEQWVEVEQEASGHQSARMVNVKTYCSKTSTKSTYMQECVVKH